MSAGAREATWRGTASTRQGCCKWGKRDEVVKGKGDHELKKVEYLALGVIGVGVRPYGLVDTF